MTNTEFADSEDCKYIWIHDEVYILFGVAFSPADLNV